MGSPELVFTLWDVGHGLALWITTPNGSHHWIDLGKTPEFSPSEHVRSSWGVDAVDYLIVSHPDEDHLEDLPNFKTSFDDPRILHRNKTLPNEDKFGSSTRAYQIAFEDLDKRFNTNVAWELDPTNLEVNGGVEYKIRSLDHGTKVGESTIEGNDTSLVVMLLYEGTLIVCPGDIEPLGWRALWKRYGAAYTELRQKASRRFLVAPHHGRRSGYCKEMMEAIEPHAALISDIWGESETHPAYRTDPLGVREGQDTVRYYTTKRRGRIRIRAWSGGFNIEQFDQ